MKLEKNLAKFIPFSFSFLDSINASPSDSLEPSYKLESNNNLFNSMQVNGTKSNSNQELNDIESKSDSISKNGYSTPIKVKADIEHIPKRKLEPPSMDSLNRLSGESKDVDSPKLDDHNSIVDDLSYQSTADENFNIINELQQSFGSSTFYVSSPLVARLGSNKVRFLPFKFIYNI